MIREPLFPAPGGGVPHVADVTMFWADQSGGVKRYLQAKRTWMQNVLGWQHSLVVPGKLMARSPALPGLPLPLSKGYRIPLSRRSAQKRLVELEPDLIEAGDPYQLAWTALAAGDALGIPVVAFYHSDLPEFAGRLFGERARRAAFGYARRLYRHFDAVFAPSHFTLQRLQEMGVSRAIHQPLGVDCNLFHPRHRDLSWRSGFGLAPGTTILLYAGRFAPEKNLQVLADAVELLGPRYALVAIGAGHAAPSGRRVFTLPYEGNPLSLARAMASADMLVHAGDQETFGLVALEAMASGLPAVVPAQGGLAEQVDDSRGCLVSAVTPDAFAEAIHYVAHRERGLMARSARAYALRHDWQMVLLQLAEHYRGIMADVAPIHETPLVETHAAA